LGQHHTDHVSSPKNEIHHAISAPPVSSHDSNDGLTQADAINNSHVCVSDNGRDMESASISVSVLSDFFIFCGIRGLTAECGSNRMLVPVLFPGPRSISLM
jgi:hypothetical protein